MQLKLKLWIAESQADAIPDALNDLRANFLFNTLIA